MDHIVRIEMMDDSVLLYRITETERDQLMEWMNYRTDPLNEFGNKFVVFHALPDRCVFVRINDIARIIFCWGLHSKSAEYDYVDNFNILKTDSTAELQIDDTDLADYIPDAIVKLVGKRRSLVFHLLDENNECGLLLDEDSFTERFESGFLNLPDEDGEQNYIPICNISCIEAKYSLVFPDSIGDFTTDNS